MHIICKSQHLYILAIELLHISLTCALEAALSYRSARLPVGFRGALCIWECRLIAPCLLKALLCEIMSAKANEL